MIKTGIVGASGFVGSNLMKLLLKHKKTEIAMATSTSLVGKKISEILPEIKTELEFQKQDFKELNKCDIVFLAVPHGEAKKIVPNLKCKVIDLTADHRLTNTYGLPEVFEEEIKKAELVANPGCYATACALAAYPIKENIESAVFNGISGYSGGGKSAEYDYQENIIAYSLVNHFHAKELSQILSFYFAFTPHVVNTYSGLMCTAHLFLKKQIAIEEIKEKFKEFYGNGFTKIVDKIPCTKEITGTPFCYIGGFESDKKQLVIVSAIDNLMKGSASQAIENMNLMLRLNKKQGLIE